MKSDQQGKLIICPTPLGNLGDVSLRALEALRAADVVCAEDTRVTGKLLAVYDIRKRLERLDEASMGVRAEEVIGRVLAGETVVFCSDAGMPGVSDPGARLVAAAQVASASVEVLPGPTAATTAYVASGFTTPGFYFGGFFPRKDGERRRLLEALRTLEAVLLFYESPKRLASALAMLVEVFPFREVAVCRELTKLHEEVYRAPVKQAAEEFAARERSGGIKGEVVLVIDAPNSAEREQAASAGERAAKERAIELSEQGELSHRDVAHVLQREFGLSRNGAYRIAQGSG